MYTIWYFKPDMNGVKNLIVVAYTTQNDNCEVTYLYIISIVV